jgi:hypothetical protein
MFVRPQFVLFPILAAVLNVLGNPRRRFAEVAVSLIAFAPYTLWMLARLVAMQSLFGPHSDHGLGICLYERAERAAVIGKFSIPAAAYDAPDALSLSGFLDIARNYPFAVLKTYITDGFNLVCNPGLSGLSNYLGVFPGFMGGHWLTIRDQRGLVGLIKEMLAQSPIFVGMMGFGLIAWVTALILAAVGARNLTGELRQGKSELAIVAGFAVYNAAVIWVAGTIRWTHRTPLDPVLVLLIVSGAAHIHDAIMEWKLRRT